MESLSAALTAASATFPRRLASTGVLYAASDLLAQALVRPRAPPLPAARRRCARWDAPRTLRLTLFGVLIFCPISSVWLGTVLELVPLSAGVGATVAKVALDQLVMGPLLLLAFLSYTGFVAPLAGSGNGDGPWSASALRARLRAARVTVHADYWSICKQSWLVWVPVQTITMAFIAPQNRLVFINIVSLFWNAFLSLYVAP